MTRINSIHPLPSNWWQHPAIRQSAIYLAAIILAIILLFPAFWLFSTALKSTGENVFQSPPQLLPAEPTLENIKTIWLSNDFGRYLWNSIIVSASSVILNVLFCALAAYPLARMDFRGRQVIFAAIVATLTIPFQIVMIPLFIITSQLGLTDTFLGVILPNLTSAFGIFLLRQAFQTIPEELTEAARIDGCRELGIWWHVAIPAIRPALITLAIFVFIGSWSDFLWPLIVLQDDRYYTLPLAVAKLADSAFGLDWRLVAAGSVISILPILILFVFVQRYIVPTDTASGVKG